MYWTWINLAGSASCSSDGKSSAGARVPAMPPTTTVTNSQPKARTSRAADKERRKV